MKKSVKRIVIVITVVTVSLWLAVVLSLVTGMHQKLQEDREAIQVTVTAMLQTAEACIRLDNCPTLARTPTPSSGG